MGADIEPITLIRQRATQEVDRLLVQALALNLTEEDERRAALRALMQDARARLVLTWLAEELTIVLFLVATRENAGQS